MSNNRIIKTKGIVLFETNFSEADKMLTMLTADLGKISCVAKGARKMQSRFLASAQLFAFSDVILYKGSSDTYYMNSAELIESFYSLRTDFEKLGCAMECSKFIKDNIYENQNSFDMLKLFLNTIYLLATSDKSISIIKNVFLIKASCVLGYTPNFFSCGECGTKDELRYFDIRRGSIKCKECSDKDDLTLTEGVQAAIRYIIKSDYKKLFSFEVSEEVLKEIDLFRKLYVDSKINKI